MSESRPRPPFDPELDAAYAVFSEQIPLVMTIEMAVAGREPGVYVDVSEQLLAEAGVTRREITVPGYEGAELVASVFARADHTGEGPGIYHVHGGGVISGERTIGIPRRCPGSSRTTPSRRRSSTASRRSSPTPTPSRTATRDSSGRRSTPRSSASTPAACSSRARAPEAAWPPAPRSWPGTGGARS